MAVITTSRLLVVVEYTGLVARCMRYFRLVFWYLPVPIMWDLQWMHGFGVDALLGSLRKLWICGEVQVAYALGFGNLGLSVWFTVQIWVTGLFGRPWICVSVEILGGGYFVGCCGLLGDLHSIVGGRL